MIIRHICLCEVGFCFVFCSNIHYFSGSQTLTEVYSQNKGQGQGQCCEPQDCIDKEVRGVLLPFVSNPSPVNREECGIGNRWGMSVMGGQCRALLQGPQQSGIVTEA